MGKRKKKIEMERGRADLGEGMGRTKGIRGWRGAGTLGEGELSVGQCETMGGGGGFWVGRGVEGL